jgi:hypothetical protein
MTRDNRIDETFFPSKMTNASESEQDVTSSKETTQDYAAKVLLHNATAPRVNTDLMIYSTIAGRHPGKHITIVPNQVCNILGFQASGKVKITPNKSNGTPFGPLAWQLYAPPSSRLDGGDGKIGENVIFGRYDVLWEGRPEPYELYVVEGRDGTGVGCDPIVSKKNTNLTS